MANYEAQADIVLSVNVQAEGQGDPEAVEAAKRDLADKIASGEINLNDSAYIQDIRISNLRRVG